MPTLHRRTLTSPHPCSTLPACASARSPSPTSTPAALSGQTHRHAVPSAAHPGGRLVAHSALRRPLAAAGFGYWIVEELTTGTFVGELGFADYHREIDSPLAHLPDLGWVFTPAMHGKGYATEAANAALAWASTNITTCDEVTCIVHPDNAASLRVAEKLGFRSRGHAMYRGHPVSLFTLPLRSP